jgi:molybdopterin synthase catalytic subunit
VYIRMIGRMNSTPWEKVASSEPSMNAMSQTCRFVDYLKTDAPFWKREDVACGARWVDARDSDRSAVARWAEAQHQATIQLAPA